MEKNNHTNTLSYFTNICTNVIRKSKRIIYSRLPILGRNEELRKYKMTLHNALEEYQKKFTRYRDHKFGVALIVSYRKLSSSNLLSSSSNEA